jgi:hypothetical protein
LIRLEELSPNGSLSLRVSIMKKANVALVKGLTVGDST